MNNVFKFYSDPGHAWVAVKRRLLVTLKIADKITRHSYERGQTVYLEEDCDVATFARAFELVFGEKPKFVEGSYSNRSSRIRSYAPYRPASQQPSSPDDYYMGINE